MTLLSEKMFQLSDDMEQLAKELNNKYYLNAVELNGAAMIMKDWALAVKTEEERENEPTIDRHS